jgi:hypothetical protein
MSAVEGISDEICSLRALPILTLNGHCDNPDAVSRKAAPMWVLPGFEQPELADDQMCA